MAICLFYGHLVYFVVIWYILWPFGIGICGHLVHLMVIWYIFPRFGTLYQEKSGNPASSSFPSSGENARGLQAPGPDASGHVPDSGNEHPSRILHGGIEGDRCMWHWGPILRPRFSMLAL
jgi:hypothetical protein